MALLGLKSELRLASAILAVFLGLSSTGEGFKQEMWLYTATGNALYFTAPEPDLTTFSSTLPKIIRMCATGRWKPFASVNYKDPINTSWSADGFLFCRNFNATNVKSVRHWAASDTSLDAVSLYNGEDYDGEEIYQIRQVRTNISIPIGSLAATGTSNWMLYEGKNLDGDSRCYKVPQLGDFSWDSLNTGELNLTAIGSIFKGCDAEEIRLYKESNVM